MRRASRENVHDREATAGLSFVLEKRVANRGQRPDAEPSRRIPQDPAGSSRIRFCESPLAIRNPHRGRSIKSRDETAVTRLCKRGRDTDSRRIRGPRLFSRSRLYSHPKGLFSGKRCTDDLAASTK